MREYSHGNTPSNELQIYTWMDASLKELTSLIRDVNPDTRRKGETGEGKSSDENPTLTLYFVGTYFDFALVYPDRDQMGAHRMREIGVTCSGQRGADDSKTLQLAKFQIGDYLDINITPANNRKPEQRPERRDRRPY